MTHRDLPESVSVSGNGVTPSTVVSKPARRSTRRNKCIVPVVMITSVILALNTAISHLVVQINTPKVVAFDMKGTLDTFMDQSARKELSPEDAALLSDRFSRAVNASLKAWNAEHHALVLVAPAVVTGATDVTNEIQQMIAERMHGGGNE